ncbi:MAG: ATP-dependent RecD-like DNA helicase [Firmicutes bacterium]|nr:ATP-dependent RecD-like DNA helicase [Bacillota bacterium]
MLDLEVLEGTVERITFRNEENLYTVARLKTEESDEQVTAVGRFISIHPGESFRLRGEWTTHPLYGRQFRVEEAEPLMPATIEGITNYLASGLIKGVGPATAKKLVDAFGLDTLEIITKEPQRLLEIEGIGPVKAEAIQKGLAQQEDIQNVMVFLQGHGISTAYANRIYRHYRQDAIAILSQNPYRLADEVSGIGFRIADSIAGNLGIVREAPQRLRAGIKYTLEQGLEEGHVCLPREYLLTKAQEILEVPPELIAEELDHLTDTSILHLDTIGGEVVVYLPLLKAMEEAVAERLLEWSNPDSSQDALPLDLEPLLVEIEAKTGIKLAREQKKAVLEACKRPLLIITGGPGTGKTTIVRLILEMYDAFGWKTLLASPTGRAAKRLAEATGRRAQTIHRLLEFGYDAELGLHFRRNADNPLKADAVIIDEVSMVDLRLFYHLLLAMAPGTRLILVGDADQLPPVGPGQPLGDMLTAEAVPSVRLTEVFRQAQSSLIVTNAHRINQGGFPQLNMADGDFFLIEEKETENVAALVVKLVQDRLPSHYGVNPWEDIQVLSPIRRSRVGTENLNSKLQEALNPAAPGKEEATFGGSIFRVGDKVMQTENDYDKQVFNGDMGRIVALDREDQELVVEFADAEGVRYIPYQRSDWDQLELSYAISVHKSQGSEYSMVVMPLVWTLPTLMNRNLLYTAITRAKRLVVLIGEKRALAVYVRQIQGKERYTGLVERLANSTIK